LENPKGRRDQSEDLGVDEKIILEWIFGIRLEGVNLMHLAQEMDQWWTLVNSVTNLRVL
jgi:hypothetical protein